MTIEEAVEVLKERYITCVGIGLDNHANRVNEALDMAIEALSAEARPTGEWTNAGVLTVHCSNCKSEFHELEAMNFCPNCGARMSGEDGE